MAESKASKRLDWIDLSKGIAIILMVAGHTSIPEVLSKWIWSFHMPLFFIISGFLYNEEKYSDFKKFLVARTRSLLIPYAFFSIVVCLGYTGTEYFKPKELLYGWSGYALWFVPVLFFSELFFNRLVVWTRNRKAIILPSVLVLSLLGLWLSSCNYHTVFKIEVVPFAVLFYGFGYCFKDIIKDYHSTMILSMVLLILNFALSQFLPKLDMCLNLFGQYPMSLLNAILGTVAIIFISKYLCMSKYLKIPVIWCGQNTLLFMALSQLLNYWLLTAINFLHISKVAALPLRYLLLFGLIYAFSRFFNKFCPILVGKYAR